MVGEPAGALLTARNPGRRPTRSIVVDEHIGASIIPVTVPTLAPNADHRTFYQLPTERRARVRIGPAEVVRADPLRLLRRRVGHAPATDLWVHPRWALVEALPSGFAKDLEGPTSDASPAGDIAFHALRPYQLGDDRRHIHWMSTARSGTLMVRHYVDNRRPTLAVLLDDADAPVRRRLVRARRRGRDVARPQLHGPAAADLGPLDHGMADGPAHDHKVATACSRH